MRLFLIADDFTGALDTGVQFAERGASVQVVTDPERVAVCADGDIQVLILDAETRHMEPKAAYDVVFRAVRQAVEAGFTHIYKKTDSALRGNIGSELQAVLDASGKAFLPFIPAFPQMGRVTRRGVQYIDGVPVAESVFGQDPFEPVRCSYVPDIIAEQSDVPVAVLSGKAVLSGGDTAGNGAAVDGNSTAENRSASGIRVYDAEDAEDLERIGRTLGEKGLTVCAGCAGFGLTLAGLLGLNGTAPALPALPPAFYVVCGSVNPVTLRQMACAEEAGFLRVHLTPEQKLEADWPDSPAGQRRTADWLADFRRSGRAILDANDPAGDGRTVRYAEEKGLTTEDLRVRISGNLGKLAKRLLDGGLDGALLCTGGDTLLALMRETGVGALTPVREVSPGVVLAAFSYGGRERWILTKSGGFGEPELFCKLASMVGAG